MAKKPVNELKCTFLSTSQNEALARNIVSGFILPLDPDIDELADIRCAVSEAVTNCVVMPTDTKRDISPFRQNITGTEPCGSQFRIRVAAFPM